MLIFTSRVIVPLTLGLTLVVTPAFVSAQQAQRFAEAALFFELNDTAGDLGIHAAIDGQAWTDLVIRGPVTTVMVGCSTSSVGACLAFRA